MLRQRTSPVLSRCVQPASGQHQKRAVSVDVRVRVGSALWLTLLSLGCPQLLQDDFSLGDPAPDGLDLASGGDAALDLDAGGTAGGLSAAGGAGSAGGGGWQAQGSGGATAPLCPNCGTCNDGVRNQNETGVDCGGVCNACACSWGPFGTPERLTGLGFLAQTEQWGPTLSSDALTLVLSSTSADSSEDLFIATRTTRGSLFSRAAALTALDGSADEGTPFLSLDGLSLYFYSTRAGGLGGRDIYSAQRSNVLGPFDNPSSVGGVNSAYSEHMPWLPADELSLYFTSARAGGAGGYDLWVGTRRARNNSFADLRNLAELNTASNDEGASLTADELSIFFASNRPGGTGIIDIYMAERATRTASFSTPVIVPGINTVEDELNVAVSADGRELFFTSDRGTGSNHVLWRASRVCQ